MCCDGYGKVSRECVGHYQWLLIYLLRLNSAVYKHDGFAVIVIWKLKVDSH